MVEGGSGPEFPVVFYDGESEMNIGTIRIYPLLQFKAFQLMLSQRIGISPNQISIYLCDQKKSSKFEDRRRIPVTGKSNFGLISREKDCFFLVVLKRSRKSRNKKMLKSENLILLRRTDPELNHFGFGSDFGPGLGLNHLRFGSDFGSGFESGFYDNYSCSNMMYLSDPDPNPNPSPFLSKCEQCKGKTGNEKVSGFHHCINDPVIIGGYRSRFGPVGGPVYFLLNRVFG